ncbi:hypothetical protein DV704_02365 [Meiothermus sp. QL-1]|uniref:hypothetical protein n=1 Tax=Meiothermus sp. QL-1 TaxID=2058095 RepID=UPI000E0B5D1C|nr:hypothetical protein [Meiothermus sp. QL-1]RDI96673.1 hypothetical protein DV704_02365 [Meiothermus sp. QL-1]
MSPWFHLGFALYLLNLLVGLAAQLGLGPFGLWHHLLYLGVFLGTLAALAASREAWLWLTVACLALFPKARPRTWLHPTLGVLGLLGYLLALRG